MYFFFFFGLPANSFPLGQIYTTSERFCHDVSLASCKIIIVTSEGANSKLTIRRHYEDITVIVRNRGKKINQARNMLRQKLSEIRRRRESRKKMIEVEKVQKKMTNDDSRSMVKAEYGIHER